MQDSTHQPLNKPATVPLPPGIQDGRGMYKACLTVNHRSQFLGYHLDIPSAIAARAKAAKIRDRHIRKGLPLTVAQLRQVPEDSIRRKHGPLVDLLAPHADSDRARAATKNHARMLCRRWREWAPANLELAREVIAAAERRLARENPDTVPKPPTTPPPGRCPKCGRRGERLPAEALAHYAFEPDPIAISAGIAAPGILPRAFPTGEDGLQLPWDKWLEGFESELKSRGDTAQHVRDSIAKVREILGTCGPDPLSKQAIVKSVAAIVARGRSLRTANWYLIATRSFLKWCGENRRSLVEGARMPLNEAVGIRTFKAAKDRRHRRAAFSDEQLTTLIEEATASENVWGEGHIAGPDRAALYFAAAATGLRAGTLKVIRVEQFHIAESKSVAFVRVYASQLKDAEDLTIPITTDAAAFLRGYFASKPAGSLAFKFPGKPNLVKMLRRDLACARIRYCETAGGRRTNVLDFHSLRKTFGTRCARARVPLPTLQKWMGHSDPKLTANIYVDAGLDDDPAVLALIPRILPAA